MTPGGDPSERTAPPAGTGSRRPVASESARGRPGPGSERRLRPDTPRVSTPSGPGARRAASPTPRPPSPPGFPGRRSRRAAALTCSSVRRISPRSGLDAMALRSGLRTRRRPAAGGRRRGRRGRRRDGRAGRGVRTGEKAAARESWRRGPACRRGSWRAAGSEGPRGAAPLAARRRPPDSVPSAALSGRRREPPRSSRCGAQRPRRQLLPSHHLAVTASQKRPRLAAAGARDGRGPPPPVGRALGSRGWRGPGARRAGQGGARRTLGGPG